MLEVILYGAAGAGFMFLLSGLRLMWDVLKNKRDKQHLGVLLGSHDSPSGLESAMPKTRFCVHKAINGRILEISVYKPNPHGPDWTSDFYLLAEGEKLSEALALVITMKGLSE